MKDKDGNARSCDRRSFLSRIGWSILAMSGASVSTLSADIPQEAPPVLVGDTTDMDEIDVRTGKYHGVPIIMVKDKKNVRVLSAVCTHQGCTVEWNSRSKKIECPCHGGEYDLEGGVVEGPPPSRLIEYPSEVRDGKVFIVKENE